MLLFLFFGLFLLFYELMIDPQPTFLGPGYSSRTVNNFLIKGKTIKKKVTVKKFRACASPHFGAFLTWGRRSKGRRSVGHLYVGK